MRRRRGFGIDEVGFEAIFGFYRIHRYSRDQSETNLERALWKTPAPTRNLEAEYGSTGIPCPVHHDKQYCCHRSPKAKQSNDIVVIKRTFPSHEFALSRFEMETLSGSFARYEVTHLN